ncbi:MAG: hypothetical protein RRZ38_13960 [Hafnia sp.]
MRALPPASGTLESPALQVTLLGQCMKSQGAQVTLLYSDPTLAMASVGIPEYLSNSR